MTKPHRFRPTVAENELEERVVMSVSASQVATRAVLLAPTVKPVATSSAVTVTLNQLHSALLSYENSVSTAILYAESQITAGTITQATAINLLEAYIGNKTSALFFQTRAAAGHLPYGAGFNGFVNSTKTAVGDLPSGSDSLYALLTFPSNPATTGPIATLQSNVFTPLANGDFNGALQAVSTTAIHSTYAQVKSVVSQYIVNGVKAHDFTFHS